jgi:hypothetical protein
MLYEKQAKQNVLPAFLVSRYLVGSVEKKKNKRYVLWFTKVHFMKIE